MNVNIYVSTRGSLPRYGFLPLDKPISRLPRGENWKYVRSVDTAQFNLPEVIEEEIDRRGFWSFGGQLSQSAERRAPRQGLP